MNRRATPTLTMDVLYLHKEAVGISPPAGTQNCSSGRLYTITTTCLYVPGCEVTDQKQTRADLKHVVSKLLPKQ